MPEKEDDLVRAAQQGAGPEAQRAFEALVARWQRPVWRFLVGLIRDKHHAEDLALEVFLRAWKRLPALRDPGAFRGYLFTSAQNLAVDYRRSRTMKAIPGLYGPEILEAFPMDAADPTLPEMRRAIASLPADSLHILQLKYEQGLTYEEIGQHEGISVSTVRDRVVVARERLETVLSRGGFLDPYVRVLEEKRRRRAEGRRGASAGDPPLA